MTDFATPFRRGMVSGVVGLSSQPLVIITVLAMAIVGFMTRRWAAALNVPSVTVEALLASRASICTPRFIVSALANGEASC